MRTAAVLTALADADRLQLVSLLAVPDENCLCHLAKTVPRPQHVLLAHMDELVRAALAHRRERGAWAHYRLSVEGRPCAGKLFAARCAAGRRLAAVSRLRPRAVDSQPDLAAVAPVSNPTDGIRGVIVISSGPAGYTVALSTPPGPS